MPEITVQEAHKLNTLIELCQHLTSDRPHQPIDEIIAKIKSLVQGTQHTEKGLYWNGLNLRP